MKKLLAGVTTPRAPTTLREVPDRSKLLNPEHLVAGWPSDKWEDWRPKEAWKREQVDRAVESIWPRLKAWADGEAREMPGLQFYGMPGRAKTGVALLLALRLARRGFLGKFVTAESLAAEVSSTAYDRRQGETILNLKMRYLAPAVLILDDICSRTYQDKERGFFLDLVRTRASRKRLTMLTTNLLLEPVMENGKKVMSDGARRYIESLDGRVLSTYSGFSFNADEWGPSLRGPGKDKS